MKSIVFDIQRFSVHNGPGIRTTVFFKGCPLRCLWCANPESREQNPQVAFSTALCNKCGDCVSACPKQAITLSNDAMDICRDRCDNCAKCVGACASGAIRLYGYEMTVEDVVKIVTRDSSYYESTGGGVTASGGEALAQGPFVKELFKECKALGIHTCLDTCGHGSSSTLKEVLRYSDLVLFDVKLVDDLRHQSVTGVSNGLLLRNLYAVAEENVPLIIRVPLVPGINSSPQDIEAIVRLVSSLPRGQSREVNLLPYHRFGANKYEMLGIEYKLGALQTLKPSDLEVEQAKQIFEKSGIRCEVVV